MFKTLALLFLLLQSHPLFAALADAVDQPTWTVTSSGSAGAWTEQSITFNTGGSALQTPAMGPYGVSIVSVSVNGPGIFFFNLRWDRIDNRCTISITLDGATQSFFLSPGYFMARTINVGPGSHSVVFSVSNGTNQASADVYYLDGFDLLQPTPTSTITPTRTVTPSFTVSPTPSMTPTITATYTPNFLEQSIEASSLNFVSEGNPLFLPTNGTSSYGGSAACATSASSTDTFIETTVQGPGRISYELYAGSTGPMSCWVYDKVLIDGQVIRQFEFNDYSHKNQWLSSQDHINAGRHTIRWKVDSFNFSGNAIQMCLDNVNFIPDQGGSRPGQVYSYPNPFSGNDKSKKTLTFHFLPCSRAEFEVYNIMGRRIATLRRATIQAAFGYAFWDGQLDDSSYLVPGIYVYLLKTEAGVLKGKFTVVAK